MEIIKCLNNAIEYIEDNLNSSIKVDDIAKVALTSRYHFQRMFHAITGFTITEYIRNRRLTLAGEELTSKDSKIIDIAVKYGYDSPDAFTKAFQRLHGVTPSMIKKGNVRLKAFPKLSFQISIKGECEMDYRIVEKDEFKVFGVDFITTELNNALYKEIPEFCDRIWEDGTHLKMNQLLGYPRMHMLYGYHYGFKEDGSRSYMMGWKIPEAGVPKEYKVLDVPASTWAVFEGKGNMEQNLAIQEVWIRIYAEWFPSSGFEQVEGPCIEKYDWDDEKYDNYTCEVWIPVRRKKE
ncbi:AraC family transcriptional regulator [Anaeromicropila herbilytica]|uniref:AraC family transcriptional regulator n=1 Tax=Anaeromicropila herbilytica TaxID=2785025 RepID=A0A7R7IE97_9FIRM|nr:AraC family transcriptional regulator [Anaeromicropila herbilytica]BCN31879.1 AraC family transcriptional regulator [Anaeromicropila herbilytica]